jgi:hypothetical protein
VLKETRQLIASLDPFQNILMWLFSSSSDAKTKKYTAVGTSWKRKSMGGKDGSFPCVESLLPKPQPQCEKEKDSRRVVRPLPPCCAQPSVMCQGSRGRAPSILLYQHCTVLLRRLIRGTFSRAHNQSGSNRLEVRLADGLKISPCPML